MLLLNAELRKEFGKKLETGRKAGKLPVVAYGRKEKSTPYFVNAVEFVKIWQKAGESSVVTLKVGAAEKDVLIHDVTLDPVNDHPIHADLYVIESGSKVRVKVPLVFTGVAPAVKALGGILVKVLHEVEVEAFPKNLPHELSVDIGGLEKFEDRVTIKDIKLGEGVKIVFPTADEIIALATPPKEEKEEEAAPVDLTRIEVEKKGKKPEEEGEAAAAPADAKKEAKK